MASSSDLWLKHRADLAGGWKCISYALYTTPRPGPNDKPISYPHGPTPNGRSYMSPEGYVSAHLANPTHLQEVQDKNSSQPWSSRGDAEIARVARGLSMYCGWMELFEDEEGLYWKTKVEIASDPTRVGGFQTRRVEHFEEGGECYKVLRPEGAVVLEVSLFG